MTTTKSRPVRIAPRTVHHLNSLEGQPDCGASLFNADGTTKWDRVSCTDCHQLAEDAAAAQLAPVKTHRLACSLAGYETRPAHEAACGATIPQATGKQLTGTNCDSLTTCEPCIEAVAKVKRRTTRVDPMAAVERSLARERGEAVPVTSTDHRREAQLFAGYLTGAAYSTAQQLDHVTSLIEQAELLRAELVERARQEGMSWAEIGQNVGTSKQGAAQRWGKKPTPRPDAAQLMLPSE